MFYYYLFFDFCFNYFEVGIMINIIWLSYWELNDLVIIIVIVCWFIWFDLLDYML